MSTTLLVKKFKKHLKDTHNIELDLRVHAYLDNNRNLLPTFDYKFAELVVAELYSFAEDYLEEHSSSFKPPYFEYNLNMECEKLRTSKLSHLIYSVCDQINNFLC